MTPAHSLVRADNATMAWDLLVKEVMKVGMAHESRAGRTIELLNVTVQISRPVFNLIDHPARRMPHRFSIAEMIWILTGQNRVDMITPYNSGYDRFSDDRVHMFGAYGPMVEEQLPWIIRELEEKPGTRQAVLTIWRPRPGVSKDIPCTVALQFILRNNQLFCTSTMRSNDVFWGFPSDCYVFTSIQRYVASALGVELGYWTHNVGSMHIYEHHWADAEAVASDFVSWSNNVATPDPSYPWPMEVLESLISQSSTVKGSTPPGWAHITRALQGLMVNDEEFNALVRRGIQPKGDDK